SPSGSQPGRPRRRADPQVGWSRAPLKMNTATCGGVWYHQSTFSAGRSAELGALGGDHPPSSLNNHWDTHARASHTFRVPPDLWTRDVAFGKKISSVHGFSI